VSAYVDRVAHNLRGLEAVSTGVCPGCDECRQVERDYVPREDDESDVETWSFNARPGEVFADEDAAIAAARLAFDDDWHGADFSSSAGFSRGECGICGSRLGGDREVWHGIADGRILHFDDACCDCVAYLANGEVPAETESADGVTP
jgi:hypothetical protein